jgi:hypothetical protein
MKLIYTSIILGLSLGAGLTHAQMPKPEKSCKAQVYKWVGQDRTNKCSAEVFELESGSSRLFAANGVRTAKGVTHRGSVQLLCDNGRLINQFSQCSGASAELEADGLSSIRMTTLDQVKEVNDAKQAEAALLQVSNKSTELAKSINTLSDDGALDGWTSRIQVKADELRQDAEIAKSSIGGVIGQGLTGVIVNTTTPRDITGLIVRVSAKFGHADGSRTKYVDNNVCVGLKCETVRTSVSVTKAGGGGHYWGYEQSTEQVFQIPVTANANTPVTIQPVAQSLAIHQTVTLDYKSAPTAAQVQLQQTRLYPQELSGKVGCAASISELEYQGCDPNTNSPRHCSGQAVHRITPLQSALKICPTTEIIAGTSFSKSCSRFSTSCHISGNAKGDKEVAASSFTCPPGTDKSISGNTVLCRFK